VLEPPSALIFDFDGTIGDSMGVWDWVDREFLRRRGLTPPPDYGRKLSTLGFVSAADYVIDEFSLTEDPEAIMDEWNTLAYEQYSTMVGFKPFALEYVSRLRAKGMRTSIATTLSPVLLEAALERNGARDMFDAVATGYDVDHDKNEPDIYLLAAERMNVPARTCIVFEDIVPGTLSAKRAGMRTVGVADGSGHQEVELLRTVADLFIEGFHELL
jgi:beta-phosphoglucomutase-like phosphatase (HAD superfamily)